MNEHLGPLPTPWRAPVFDGREKVYTADQMLAYAAQEVAAERERCANICLDWAARKATWPGHVIAARACAAAIRNPVLP